MQCSAVQCSAVQCSVDRCKIVHCTAVHIKLEQCCADLCSAIQYNSDLNSAVQCRLFCRATFSTRLEKVRDKGHQGHIDCTLFQEFFFLYNLQFVLFTLYGASCQARNYFICLSLVPGYPCSVPGYPWSISGYPGNVPACPESVS